MSAGRLCDYSGMTYRDIEHHGGIQWPFPAGATGAGADRGGSTQTGTFQTRRRQGEADCGGLGAVPRAAERRVPARAQHRPHGRALAHAHQDRQGADPRAAVAERLGGDEPARRAAAAPQAAGQGGRGVAPRPRARRRAARHRDRGAGADLRALPLRRGQREPDDAERVRPDLARAELQAVGGARRARRGWRPRHESAWSSSATAWRGWPASSRSSSTSRASP